MTVETYLERLAHKLDCDVKSLHFERHQGVYPYKFWKRITDLEKDFVYIKPDTGFGSLLQLYRVIFDGNQVVTTFGLYEFPSCCAFCVSTKSNVREDFRGKGVNSLTNKLRQEIAKVTGYTALICTDVQSNINERRTLENNDFINIYQVKNKRTGNVVNISVKELE